MKDIPLRLSSGYVALLVHFLSILGLVALFFYGVAGIDSRVPGAGWMILLAVLGVLCWLISLGGYIVINPNNARVLQLFGTYVGTLSETGFYWGNPFYSKTRSRFACRDLRDRHDRQRRGQGCRRQSGDGRVAASAAEQGE